MYQFHNDIYVDHKERLVTIQSIIVGMQKQPSCKKEAWLSKVESYLKGE